MCSVRPCQLEEGDTHRLLTRYTAIIKAEAASQVFVETHTLASPGHRGEFGLESFYRASCNGLGDPVSQGWGQRGGQGNVCKAEFQGTEATEMLVATPSLTLECPGTDLP